MQKSTTQNKPTHARGAVHVYAVPWHCFARIWIFRQHKTACNSTPPAFKSEVKKERVTRDIWTTFKSTESRWSQGLQCQCSVCKVYWTDELKNVEGPLNTWKWNRKLTLTGPFDNIKRPWVFITPRQTTNSRVETDDANSTNLHQRRQRVGRLCVVSKSIFVENLSFGP